MKKIIAIFLFPFLLSCSMQEDVICESGTGYLYKDGVEFVCPFALQKQYVDGWMDYDGEITVLAYSVGDYFPLNRQNSPYTYKLKMKVPKEYFTEDEYAVSIYTTDRAHKPLGESREFTFYKVAESADSVEYISRRDRDGQYVFFAEREMPSYDWYHVLKVCEGGFHVQIEAFK